MPPANSPARPSLLVLVDAADVEIGVAEKLDAHRHGMLHRAVSVFIFGPGKRILLQQRSSHKYHSKGLWSNACCTHPYPGEPALGAAHRRLRAEMGFDCHLEPAGALVYRAGVGSGLVEHEYDHLFVGRYSGPLLPNSAEVEDWKWLDIEGVVEDMSSNPHRYTVWFPLAVSALARRGILQMFARGG